MNVLIIDDENLMLEYLKDVVSSYSNTKVVGTTKPSEVMELIRRHKPDLIISDIYMEELDGFELMQLCKTQLPEVLIILVTAHDMNFAHEAARKISAFGVLGKPVDVPALFDYLSKAESRLKQMAEEKQAMQQQKQQAAMNGSAQHVEPASDIQQNGGGFTGQLERFQLVDIISMCCQSKRTGKITIERGDQQAIMFLEKGEIVHAYCEPLEGVSAVHKIIEWNYGSFQIDKDLPANCRTISLPWEHIIMEGIRLKDEQFGGLEQEQVDPLIGEKIGPYLLVKEVDHGPWGRSYEATQEGVDKPVILQVLAPELVIDANKVEQFLTIAQLMAELKHPNLVAVFEAGEAGGAIYYAREKVKGRVLTEISYKNEKLTEFQVALVLVSIARSLAFLNANSISIGGFRPHNIVLLEPTGQGKLVGMGFLSLHEQENALGGDLFELGLEIIKVMPTDRMPQALLQNIIRRMTTEEGYSPYANIDEFHTDIEEFYRSFPTPEWEKEKPPLVDPSRNVAQKVKNLLGRFRLGK